MTNLKNLRAGSRVNLEVDLIARYVERMMQARMEQRSRERTSQMTGISPIQEIIEEIRAGRMVVLVDEEDRENEGDLVFAAEFVTPEKINFMAKHGRGLICLTLTEAHCKQLDLPLMVRENGLPLATNFTLSIEAASGVTTGISAADRARTIQVAAAKDAKPADIVQPGHIFPLRAQNGGVLVRAGHTEAGCDLAQLAGLTPAVGDLRDTQGRRRDGAPAGSDRVCQTARAQDRHDRRPDRTPQPAREAGRARGTAQGADRLRRIRAGDLSSTRPRSALIWRW